MDIQRWLQSGPFAFLGHHSWQREGEAMVLQPATTLLDVAKSLYTGPLIVTYNHTDTIIVNKGYSVLGLWEL